MVRIIPVIDLKAGTVVRGVGGRREEYRPIKSKLVEKPDPLEVARAFRDQLGLSEIYLADLDAIAGKPPALAMYQKILELRCALWVDAGVRNLATATVLANTGIEQVVVGQESLRGPGDLKLICQALGSDRIVFSLDLKDGQPLGDWAAWGRKDAFYIAKRAIAAGVRRLLILDLAHVGAGKGTGTGELCGRLARQFPQLDLIAGGGVRDMGDIRRLEECGVRKVLVASALHDGRIGPDDITGATILASP